jgi:hypothetical protein
VAALGLWFVLTRIFIRASVEHALVGKIAIFAGTAGAVLASVATVTTLLEAARGGGTIARAVAIVRVLLAAPVLLLVAAALRGEPPESLQLAGLAGATATLATACISGIIRAGKGMWAARVTLLFLLIGETIELIKPPAQLAAPTDSFWAHFFDKAGAISELAALLGAVGAFVWAFLSASRAAGGARTRLFMPLPILASLVFSLLATFMFHTPVQSHIPPLLARSAFGTRFDIVLATSDSGTITTAALLGYLLIPELLLCAIAVSVAGVLFDRGASARRILGWAAVMLAGFGAVRLAGPMDPIRLVLVALAAVLLERSVVLEANDRRGV